MSVDTSFGGFHIRGVITHPKISFPQKNKQVLFVNSRLIQSPIITKAISDAYKRYIPHGNHPGFILFVELDPTQVDVNVHPRKMEVRFAQESTLFRAVYHALENVLSSVTLVSDTHTDDGGTFSKSPSFSSSVPSHISPVSYYSGSGSKFKSYSPYTSRDAHPAQAAIDFTKEIFSKSENTFSPSDTITPFGDLHETPFGRIIGQIHNAYIMVQTHNGMMLLDQHALAERVIYEKLASQGYKSSSQGLIEGVGMHLDTREYETFLEYKENFCEM